MSNIEMLKPGVHVRELCFNAHELEPQYQKQKYLNKMHGVGLCDEWPLVPYPEVWDDDAYDVILQPGMVFSAESLVSPENGDFSIKLEDQVLITETGYENLTSYPFDSQLMGSAS
jgi:Xaa-Pro dipeptidase